jgi:SNF2 family DNA or RNA helicase
MLRRTKDQTLNGQRLIDLPARTVNIVSCDFDPAEKAFYDALEKKMGIVLEKLMSSSKNGNSSYISVLLLLLRLRQGENMTKGGFESDAHVQIACNHPELVTKDFKQDSEAVNPKAVKKGTSDQDGDGDDLVAAFDQLDVNRKCKFCTTE